MIGPNLIHTKDANFCNKIMHGAGSDFPKLKSQYEIDLEYKPRVFDFSINVYCWKDWYLCYDAFNNSSPYKGKRSHQLCIGPFVIEWATKTI